LNAYTSILKNAHVNLRLCCCETCL